MYCEFYQLTERPFNVTPDPKFLYLNARYREAIASLNYGITQRKGFITLIGEAGTGKTTLLKRLLEDLDPKTKTVFIFNTNVTFEEILEYIFAEFDLPVHNGKKLYMLQRLNTFLLEELRSGGNVALLIDEAQDLEFSVLEDLRLLSNLETAKEKILQIVLSGQPELGQKLSNPILRQLRQRISINCRLLPLSRDEITEYLQYRLQAAGCPDLKLFTREAEDQIYHFSRGVPRLVNVVCDNALVIGYALGKKRIGADIIKEAAADLLPVEVHDVDLRPQPAPAVAAVAPAPAVENPWRTRLAVVGMALFVVVVFLSIGRTTTKTPAGDQVATVKDPPLEVIQPGSRDGVVARRPEAVAPALEQKVGGDEPDRDEIDTGSLVVRDPRAIARRRQEDLALNRAVPDAYGKPLGVRDRFQRIEPVVPDVVQPEPIDEPVASNRPVDLRREPAAPVAEPVGREESAPRKPGGERADDAPAVDAAPRAALPPVVEEEVVEQEIVDEAADEEPIVTARAEAPEPGWQRERQPETVDEFEGSRDSGALVVDLEEAAQSETGPRLDGVRFARIRVQEGDSVSGIAIRRYGQASATILDLMKLANPNLNDVDVIVVGQTIRLPQLDEAFPILNEGDGGYSLLVYSASESWRANGLRDELQARGFSATQARATLGAGKPIFRVVVSGFSSREEVVDAGKRLQRLFREDRRIAELSNSSG